MSLEKAAAQAVSLRQGGAGDGEILMSLTAAGLTASDAEEIVKGLPGQNRAPVERVGSFSFQDWKFGALVLMLIAPLGVLYFAGGIWFVVSVMSLVGLFLFLSGANIMRAYLSGQDRGPIMVRPRVMGIPMPFTVGTNPVVVAIGQMFGGTMICAVGWMLSRVAR